MPPPSGVSSPEADLAVDSLLALLVAIGALCVAAVSDPGVARELFRKMLIWGLSMTVGGVLRCRWLAGPFGNTPMFPGRSASEASPQTVESSRGRTRGFSGVEVGSFLKGGRVFRLLGFCVRSGRPGRTLSPDSLRLPWEPFARSYRLPIRR
jgi:hypothetical protein